MLIKNTLNLFKSMLVVGQLKKRLANETRHYIRGIYFAVTDSNPRDAGVLTPMVTVPIAFIAGVLLSKLFNRKRNK